MEDFKKTANMFKAFCDENRLRIIESLQAGEKCGCILLEEVSIAQSTLSHHMKILLESKVVTSRKEGKWTYYSLSDEGCSYAKERLKTLLEKSEDYRTYLVCS